MKERELKKLEEKHASEAEFLRTERDKIQCRKKWTCIHCENKTQLDKLTIVREYWYVEPSGCTGGDYWNPSDEYWINCPKCSMINRICDTFIQIRDPWKSVNNTKTFQLVSKNTRHFKEKYEWYPQGREKGMGGITHTIIDRLRSENKKGFLV